MIKRFLQPKFGSILKNLGMSKLRVSHPNGVLRGSLELPGSKSESNRLLILKALYDECLPILGLSESKDTQVLVEALKAYKFQKEINIGDAGTAMRFLTAFLAQEEGEWFLSGSARMHERPLGVLVDALRALGAEIEYLDKEAYPPLRIKGQPLNGGVLKVDAGVSSQYLSALMMIAPKMKEGLELRWEGPAVSMPYLYLTANLMRRLGFKVFVLGNEIRIPFQKLEKPLASQAVEPDWSAASYWFSAAALANKAEIYLPGFKEYSLQGDSIVAQHMAPLGIEQIFIGGGIRIKKAASFDYPRAINLVDCPDLAQSLIPAYAASGHRQTFLGLQTLRIKETDRLQALEQELAKFGTEVELQSDQLVLKGGFGIPKSPIATYGDHRMAMGFLPLALKFPIEIENPEVVSKSYPSFWEHCEHLGFEIYYED